MPREIDVGPLTFSVSYRDHRFGSLWAVATYDCAPPPVGSVREYTPPDQVRVMLSPESLLSRDAVALQGVHGEGKFFRTFEELLLLLGRVCYTDVLVVDFDLIPDSWKQISRCFQTEIAYRAHYFIYQIQARVRIAYSVGERNFAVGETVARFRLDIPNKVQFLRWPRWNPACCRRAPAGDAKPILHTDWFPFGGEGMSAYGLSDPFGLTPVPGKSAPRKKRRRRNQR